MIAIVNLLNALAHIIDFVLYAYMWLIIIRAFLSWVNPDPYNPIVSFLYQVTEPVLYRVRRFLPIRGLGIDLSPIIILIIIIFLREFAVQTLRDIAVRLR